MLLVYLCAVPGLIFAQIALGTLTGVVQDAKTGEPLIGVNVIVDGTSKGTTTDAEGRFTLSLPEGLYDVKFSMIGYRVHEAKHVAIKSGKSTYLRIHLVEKAIELHPVTVVGERPLVNPEPELSTQVLTPKELARVSGNLEDVVRVVQTLPGVAAQADFSGRMYVRGGQADENLVLLDRLFIYEPYHLGGLVSIFNPDLIDHVEFYAGGFPAKFGNILSSVLAVTNRRGNWQETEGQGSLSLISANGHLTGPLFKNKGSWTLSMRRSYHDKLMQLIGAYKGYVFPNFHDYQLILFYPLNEANLLSFNGLRSGDRMKYKYESDEEYEAPADTGDFSWKNQLTIASLDWKFIPSPKAFVHTTVSYSKQPFDYSLFNLRPQWIRFDVKNWDFNQDATWMGIRNHKIEAGSYLHCSDVVQQLSFLRSFWILQTANQNRSVRLSDDSTRVIMDNVRRYFYVGGYLQDQWEILPPILSVSLGLRGEYFNISKQTVWSPRLSLSYRLDDHTVAKAAWGYFYQFPYDVVQMDPVNGNPHLKARRAIHYVGGLERKLSEKILARAEVYYKDLSRLIVEDPKTNFSNSGMGRSYGFELFLQKRVAGKLDGWVSYTYAVTKRRDFPWAKEYFPLQDQRHTLNLVANYHPSRKWDFAVKWLGYTGRPYTPLAGTIRDPLTGTVIPIEGEINSARFPEYHRLDVRVDRWFRHRNWDMSVYIEVINLYNRKNVFDYTWNKDYTERRAAYQLPRLPTFGVAVRF